MTLMTGSPVSAWGCRSPMLEMVKPQWRTPCNSRASSRPSSAPRIRPGSAPVGRRLGPPLWRPELALPESPKRPRSAPLRRSASAAAPAAAPAQPPAVPGRPASAGQMRPKKVQQRRSVPTATISNPESAGLDEKRAVFSSPEKAEKALASAAAEIQALCDSCRAALVVKTQCGSQLVTANFDDKERRRRATRGLKVELKAPKRKPPKPFPENIFKESAEHLPSWSQGVLSTLREGNEGLDEMERFANRVKDVDEKLKVLEEQAADLKSEPELDDLQEIKPMGPVVIRRKDSVSMMRRWSRSISPDDSGNPFLAELGRQGSRRTAHVANFQNSLGDPPRRSDSHRSRGPSKDSDLSSTRSKSSARKVVMNELDGLLDHLTKDPAEEGFSAAEVTRLRAGFKRFMMPGTIDVHKDDVFELLTFLGCVFLDPVKVRDLMDKTTRFDHLGFDDFEAFMGKYTRYCQSQYQVIFDQFDADESGTISMEELREMTHHLGFMPTRLMLEEAVEVACRSRRAAALSFNELVQFLMIYRRREGFCREEVDKLRGIHNHHSEGNPPVMPVSQLSTALIQAFGRQVTRFASELQDQLASGQILRSSQVSPDPDFEPEKLSFSEFLIMSRNCREVLHRKLDCMWPRNDEKSEGCFAAKAAIPQQGLAIKCNPGGEGTITDEELRLVLRGLGYMPLTKAMLDIYNDVIGSPIPRDLDYDEFFDFVWRFRSNCGFSSDELEDLQELYRISDEDNSGEICALELASMFRSLGYRATMEDLSGLVLEVDHDQSGFLSFSEFVTLMGDFRALELKKIYRVFDDLAVGGYLQAENITKACKRVGAHLIDQKHMPDEDDEFDFEDFVDWVDECRHDCMMRERKLAGFGWWKVECFRESFKEFDKNGNGHLEPDELLRLMRHLKISESPKTKADQKALLKLLETARKNAYEAGIREAQLEPGNSISFWTFVQLLRLLQTQKEKRQMNQLNELMEELRFSKFEVEQFRQIFVRWARYHPVEGYSDREIDTEVETLSEEQLHRIFRSAGVSLVGDGGRIRELQVGLEPLQSGGRLPFKNFLKLMRWVLDTNFANLATSISR